MFVIIGALGVIGAVIGGYLMEHGKLILLNQPAEFVVIFGAALSSMLISTPLPVIIKIGRHNLDREFLMGKTSIGLIPIA